VKTGIRKFQWIRQPIIYCPLKDVYWYSTVAEGGALETRCGWSFVTFPVLYHAIMETPG
jgi:hypothetical protein